MTRDESLKRVRRTCVEVNPGIVVNKHAQIIHQDHSVEYFEECRPIRLADVLLALYRCESYGHYEFEVDCAGFFRSSMGVIIADEKDNDIRWDLWRDDLNEQSGETINFLAELLR